MVNYHGRKKTPLTQKREKDTQNFQISKLSLHQPIKFAFRCKVLGQKGCNPEFNTMQDPKGSMGREYLYLYIYYKKTKICGKSMDI